jgi:hypothetical protein
MNREEEFRVESETKHKFLGKEISLYSGTAILKKQYGLRALELKRKGKLILIANAIDNND